MGTNNVLYPGLQLSLFIENGYIGKNVICNRNFGNSANLCKFVYL